MRSFLQCRGIHCAVCACASVVFLVTIGGCATTSEWERRRSEPDERAAREAIQSAQRALAVGERREAIPQLESTIARYPETESATDAYFYLGQAYFHLREYREAITAFREYLRLAPRGRYAQESAHYGNRVAIELKVDNLRAKLENNPDNLATQLELADLLWKRGSYEEAGDVYRDVFAVHPEYEEDTAIGKRIEKQADGTYVVLSPSEVLRRQSEAEPVVIINVASFKTGRHRLDVYGRISESTIFGDAYVIRDEPEYYAVTGQVLNRSEKPVQSVQVLVTIYGFGEVVLDTTTTHVGSLNPGEIRAFSVRFGSVDNIETVYRHECVATYQR